MLGLGCMSRWSANKMQISAKARLLARQLATAWDSGELPQISGIHIIKTLAGTYKAVGGVELTIATRGLELDEYRRLLYELHHAGLIEFDADEEGYKVLLLRPLQIAVASDFSKQVDFELTDAAQRLADELKQALIKEAIPQQFTAHLTWTMSGQMFRAGEHAFIEIARDISDYTLMASLRELELAGFIRKKQINHGTYEIELLNEL